MRVPARSADPPPAADDGGHAGSVAISLATLVGSFLLPMPLRLPLSLVAALPLLRQGAGIYAREGINSHALEEEAVSISLARRDVTAANTTLFMLALGKCMEESIARRSDELLKHLLRPSSDEVWVLRDSAAMLVPADTVAVGDSVVVGVGAVIPVDGTVLSGEATVNEAADAAMALIDRNYRLTVGLNTAIFGAATLGFLSPFGTAVLHNGTTIGILLNALRSASSGRSPGVGGR